MKIKFKQVLKMHFKKNHKNTNNYKVKKYQKRKFLKITI